MNKKILFLSILAIFIVGLSISSVSATCDMTVENTDVNSISIDSSVQSDEVNNVGSSDVVTFNCTENNAQSHGGVVKVSLTKDQIREVSQDWELLELSPDDKYRYYKVAYYKKLKKYKTVKKPVYKYKKVKKYRYVYKYKLESKYRYDDTDTYYKSYPSAWKTPKGYKYVGTHSVYYSNGDNLYVKYKSKKKLPYYKKVKYVHHYKKVKKAYYVDSKPYYEKVKCKGYVIVTPGTDDYQHIAIQVRYAAPNLKGYSWHKAYGFQTGGLFKITKYL